MTSPGVVSAPARLPRLARLGSHLPAWLPPRRLLFVVVMLIAAGVSARVLLDSASELGEAADALSDVRISWIVVCLVAETLSYVVFARAIQRLLAPPERPPLVALTGAALAAQAASQCVPGGAATSGVVAFRQVRRLGVGEVPAAASVVVANLLQACALPLLALIGAELPGSAEPIPGLRTACLGLIAAIVAVGLALVVFRDRQLPRRFLIWSALKGEQLRQRFSRGDAKTQSGQTSLNDRLGQLSVGRAQLTLASVLCLAYWVGDALCLAAAFPAVGASVPWRGLLIAYPAAQLVSVLPFLPGGLGVVEGSLTAGLVAYGGATSTALAAVLLYRLISFWLIIPTGGLSWLGLRARYPLAEESLDTAQQVEALEPV